MSDSLITKKAIAAGLKEMTKKKSFEKITVHDITEYCGLNRQTFYYHFKDKYELVDWIYYQEAISLIIEDLNEENWDSKVNCMLVKMKEDSYFYTNTLKLSSETDFREYVFKITVSLFLEMIEKITGRNEAYQDDILFIAEFYAYGIVGVIIKWVQSGMKEDPQEITTRLRAVAEGTKRYAASRYHT